MRIEKYANELKSQIAPLPIPEVADTLEQLLKWAAPLLDGQERKNLSSAAEKFLAEDSETLQRELLDFAAKQDGSWLAPMWLDGYLSSRGPLQATSNFALTFKPASLPQKESASELAADLIYRLTQVFLQVYKGQRPVETDRAGNPIDMSYYQNMFKSARLPGETKDTIHHGDLSVENAHVAVAHLGNAYLLPVTDDSGQAVSVDSLTKMITEIWAGTTQAPFVGALSGLARADAASGLALISKASHHVGSLVDAVFAMTLDDETQELTTDELLKKTLLGPDDQYFYKTIQLRVTKAGQAGVAFEHSDIDGVPAMNVLVGMLNGDYDGAGTSTTDYETLKWDLSAEAQARIADAVQQNAKTAETIAFSTIDMTEFGKTRIKGLKVSPDAFFHIALAMAQYQISQQLRSTYEPVSMRMYYQGRTDVARAISPEKLAFVEGWFTHLDDIEIQRKQFFDAATAHADRIKLVQQGQGVERHLLGLENMMKADTSQKFAAAHALFESPELAKLRTDYLSTTAVPNELVGSFSFAPTSADGLGVYYGVMPEHIVVTVSSWGDQARADAFAQAVQENLIGLANWVEKFQD